MEEKVLTIQEYSSISQESKTAGKTVVHCHGCCDLVHVGVLGVTEKFPTIRRDFLIPFGCLLH